MKDSLFIPTGQMMPRKLSKSKKGGEKRMQGIKRVSKNTARRIENAYAIIAMAAQAGAAAKVITLPKMHSSFGLLPVWQVVAAIIFAGLFYELFQLLEGKQ